jgi:hypothetical protein
MSSRKKDRKNLKKWPEIPKHDLFRFERIFLNFKLAEQRNSVPCSGLFRFYEMRMARAFLPGTHHVSNPQGVLSLIPHWGRNETTCSLWGIDVSVVSIMGRKLRKNRVHLAWYGGVSVEEKLNFLLHHAQKCE